MVSGSLDARLGPPPQIDAAVDAYDASDAEPDAEDAEPDATMDAAPPPISDPQEPGPYAVSSRSYLVSTSILRRIAIEVSSPDGLSEAPMLAMPGGLANSEAYRPMAEHLASHGFVVVQFVRVCVRGDSSCSQLQNADDINSTVRALLDDWDEVGLLVRPTGLGFIGHAYGGKFAALAAARWESRDGWEPPAFLILPDNREPDDGFRPANPDGHDFAPMVRRLAVYGSVARGRCEDQEFLLREGDFVRGEGQVVWEWFGRARWVDFIPDIGECGSTCDFCLNPFFDSDREVTQRALRRYSAAFFRFTLRGEVAAEPWLAEVDEGSEIMMTRYPDRTP